MGNATKTVNPYADIRSDQLAPHNTEAEEAVLGAILISAEVYPAIALILEPQDFFIIRHQWIFEAMKSLHERGLPIDYLTVVSELEIKVRLAELGGAAYILSLINKTPSALNAEGYAKLVQDMSDRRGLIDGASKVARAAHADSSQVDTDQVIDQAFGAMRKRKGRIEVLSMDEIAVKADEYEAAVKALKAGESLAIPTGFTEIDRVTDHQIGYEKLWYVLGETRHGKSSFCQQVAMNMIESGVDWVLYCSIEMTPVNLHNRIVAARAGVPLSLYRDNKLNAENWAKWHEANRWLRAQTNFHVSAKKVSPADVRRMADMLGYKYHSPGVVIIDTVNKMKGVNLKGQGGRTEGLTNVSEELDSIKLDGHLVIGILQHKIDRTGARKPADLRPSMETIKESGAPGQDADILTSVYCADMYRLKFGPAWDDPHCPPDHVMVEALKSRDGDSMLAPALLRFERGIPRMVNVKRTVINLEQAVDQAYAQKQRDQQLQFEAAAHQARINGGGQWSDDSFDLMDGK